MRQRKAMYGMEWTLRFHPVDLQDKPVNMVHVFFNVKYISILKASIDGVHTTNAHSTSLRRFNRSSLLIGQFTKFCAQIWASFPEVKWRSYTYIKISVTRNDLMEGDQILVSLIFPKKTVHCKTNHKIINSPILSISLPFHLVLTYVCFFHF